jgi:hypothetical protein
VIFSYLDEATRIEILSKTSNLSREYLAKYYNFLTYGLNEASVIDGVKIYCPLRAVRHFIKHGVVYQAPRGIYCRTLTRGPKNCFISSIGSYINKDGELYSEDEAS